MYLDEKLPINELSLSNSLWIPFSVGDYARMIQRGVGGSQPPLKNHKNIGFLSNTGMP